MSPEVTYRTRIKSNSGLNVYEAAQGRMRWLFDEFENNVHVATSGGKDSAVIMELAAEVARERGVTLQVHFLDQEAEWESTRDYIRDVKDHRDDIELTWYQVPFRLFNATSYDGEWAHMWPDHEPEAGYMREPEPDAVRVNDFGTDRFKDLLHAIHLRNGGAVLTGMRMEESPNRRLGNTVAPSYKWATWGTKYDKLTRAEKAQGGKPYWAMSPIYDWSYRDVWHYLDSNDLPYNRLYDEMFRYGVKTRDMRVSSLIHTASVTSLNLVQEIEPQTWVRLTQRFPGVNAYGHVGKAIEQEFQKKRPQMFLTWHSYLEHLVTNLVPDPENQQVFWEMHEEAQRALPWIEEDLIDRQLISQVFRNNHFKQSAFAKWVINESQKAGTRIKNNELKRIKEHAA